MYHSIRISRFTLWRAFSPCVLPVNLANWGLFTILYCLIRVYNLCPMNQERARTSLWGSRMRIRSCKCRLAIIHWRRFFAPFIYITIVKSILIGIFPHVKRQHVLGLCDGFWTKDTWPQPWKYNHFGSASSIALIGVFLCWYNFRGYCLLDLFSC